MDEHVAGHSGRELGIGLEKLIGAANQGLGPGGIAYGLWNGQRLYLTLQEGCSLHQAQQLAPVLSLHHDPHVVSRQTQDLFDIGDGAHGEQILLPGLLHRQILLGHQKPRGPGGHSLVQGLDRRLPAHVKVEQHIGKNGKPPESQYRHRADIGISLHGKSLPFRLQNE